MYNQRRGQKIPSFFVAGIFLLLIFGFCFVEADTAEAGLADHIVINEIQIDSVGGTGGTEDDWIELFNPTSQEVSLEGWSIQRASASGSSLARQALSGTISAGSYYLIVRNGSSTAQILKEKADLLVADSFSLSGNNIIFLVNNNENISSPSDLDIIDFVGYGTALFFEGTAAALNIPEEKSISRYPDGEDNNQNSNDFVIQDTPGPQGSSGSGGNDNPISGSVVLTINHDPINNQNITSNSAEIIFQANDSGQAFVTYGLTSAYGSSTLAEDFLFESDKVIGLTGLHCNTTYHYAIHAQNTDASETDQTSDATFTTLPCGIVLNNLVMTKTAAKANNNYSNGWEWQFDITVWNIDEASFKMKFNSWSGPVNLDAGGNMQFSIDNGTTWQDIMDNNSYGATGAKIGNIDNNNSLAGRQLNIVVRMKVPAGTRTGTYNSNWGILTE